MTQFVKQRERVFTLKCSVALYLGGDNIFIGDDPKGWPYGIIERHNAQEEWARSLCRGEPLISVEHRCALDPIDGNYYCERELSFALASREGEAPEISPPRDAGGSVIPQPPSPHGAVGFNSHALNFDGVEQ